MTAAVQNVRMVVAAAAARGIAPGKLLAAIDLDPHALIATDSRVPSELVLRAWQAAAELCGDPAFGLTAVDHLASDYLGGFGFAVHASATLGEALRRIVRFFPLVNQHAALELIEDGAVVRLRIAVHADVPDEAVRHPAECLLGVVLRIARRTTGADIRPVAVAFRHAAPAETSVHHRLFGVVPRFAQPHHELVFHRAVLDTRHVAPDAGLASLAERHLERCAGDLPPAETFTGRVRRVLLEELQLGEPTLARLAARLRMSERTVQRRLGDDGTSMQAVLDEVRCQISIRQLAESTRTIAEISYAVGFAEVRAFHRAFKRWTGSTPAAYRQSRAAS
ncbi:MAG TPA: AraC family transcriptional regulator [Kofleriaceae bacterium]|jgi:AraC-like DNA-binding protein|nr:AraC family transcriptional regulator [Kofleriaceae bacterium]